MTIKKKVMLILIPVVLLVVIAMMLKLSNVFLKLDKVKLFVSGGDFSQIIGEKDDQLDFSHGIETTENNSIYTANYKLKISGKINLTIYANGELQESLIKEGTPIYMGTLKGEVRIGGKTYVVYANVDKEINGEALFASITLQEKEGSLHAFFSVGEPMILIDRI